MRSDGNSVANGAPSLCFFPNGGERAQDHCSLSLWERVGAREPMCSFECTLARVWARGDRGLERAEANASQP